MERLTFVAWEEHQGTDLIDRPMDTPSYPTATA